MPRIPSPVGRRVREYRIAQGLTQQALAELTGGAVDREYIAGLETGRYRNIGLDKAEALAGALGVSIDELRRGRPEAAPQASPFPEPSAEKQFYLARLSLFPVELLDRLDRIAVTLYFSRLKQPVPPGEAEGEEHECIQHEEGEDAPRFGPE